MFPAQLCEILAQILGVLAGIPFVGGFFEGLLGILDGLCDTGEPAAQAE